MKYLVAFMVSIAILRCLASEPRSVRDDWWVEYVTAPTADARKAAFDKLELSHQLERHIAALRGYRENEAIRKSIENRKTENADLAMLAETLSAVTSGDFPEALVMAQKVGVLPPSDKDIALMLHDLKFYLQMRDAISLLGDIRYPGTSPKVTPDNERIVGVSVFALVRTGRALMALGVLKAEPAYVKLGSEIWQNAWDSISEYNRQLTLPALFKDSADKKARKDAVDVYVNDLMLRYKMPGAKIPSIPMPPGSLNADQIAKRDVQLTELTAFVRKFNDAHNKADGDYISKILSVDMENRDRYIKAATERHFQIQEDQYTKYELIGYNLDEAELRSGFLWLIEGEKRRQTVRVYKLKKMDNEWRITSIGH